MMKNDELKKKLIGKVVTKYPKLDCDVYDFSTKNFLTDFTKLIESKDENNTKYLNHCRKYTKDGRIFLSADTILSLSAICSEELSEIDEMKLNYFLSVITLILEKNNDRVLYSYQDAKNINKVFLNNDSIDKLMEFDNGLGNMDDVDYYKTLENILIIADSRYSIVKVMPDLDKVFKDAITKSKYISENSTKKLVKNKEL